MTKKLLIIVPIVMILIGIVMILSCFAAIDFNTSKFADGGNLKTINNTFDVPENDIVSFKFTNSNTNYSSSVKFVPSTNGKINISSKENKKIRCQINIKGNEITVNSVSDYNFMDVFALNIQKQEIVVEIPDSLNVKIDLNNTGVNISNLNFGKLDMESKNLSINLNNVNANNINLVALNGNINLEKLTSENIDFVVKNGFVSGSVVGKESDYSIKCKLDNATSNIDNSESNPQTMNINVTNGMVNVKFV